MLVTDNEMNKHGISNEEIRYIDGRAKARNNGNKAHKT